MLNISTNCKRRLKMHGLSYHPLYKTWSSIINRCTNPNASNYSRFGGKGITVCEEW